MKRTAATELNSRIAQWSKFHKSQKEGNLTSYCEAVNYLIETYATEDVIAKTDANMMLSTQPSIKLSKEYAEALWNKALHGDRAYDKYILRRIFIQGLLEPMQHSMRLY